MTQDFPTWSCEVRGSIRPEIDPPGGLLLFWWRAGLTVDEAIKILQSSPLPLRIWRLISVWYRSATWWRRRAERPDVALVLAASEIAARRAVMQSARDRGWLVKKIIEVKELV